MITDINIQTFEDKNSSFSHKAQPLFLSEKYNANTLISYLFVNLKPIVTMGQPRIISCVRYCGILQNKPLIEEMRSQSRMTSRILMISFALTNCAF